MRNISYIICSDQCIICLIFSAKAVRCVLGHAITLICPVALPSSDVLRSVKEWFRGFFPKSQATLAKMVTKGVHVEYNHTADQMWINSLDGDLIITNLTMEDMGFYTCRFTGSREQTIELYVSGMFDSISKDISWAEKMIKE